VEMEADNVMIPMVLNISLIYTIKTNHSQPMTPPTKTLNRLHKTEANTHHLHIAFSHKNQCNTSKITSINQEKSLQLRAKRAKKTTKTFKITNFQHRITRNAQKRIPIHKEEEMFLNRGLLVSNRLLKTPKNEVRIIRGISLIIIR